jgi:putative ABC transport system permease protein
MPFRLVVRNLQAHPLRSLLTLGSVFLAVFLLCVLRAATAALTTSVEKASTDRLWVQSAVSLFVNLPEAYAAKIEAVEGVEALCRFQWFGGVYRDPSNFFAQFGVDPATFGPTYPEIEIAEGSYDAFARDRIGCVIGLDLASQFGWKLGDRIPLQGTIFPRAGDAEWEFTVEAIYRSTSTNIDQRTMYFHYDYLRESLEAGAASGPPGVGVYLVRKAKGAEVTQVMADIDALFEHGPQRVQTTTEAEFQRSFLTMLGNVPALLGMIGAAVLFAIFFAVLNTMLMAARERMRSVGVMKALGFTDGAILATLVFEGLLLCGLGGLLGVALAYLGQDGVARFLINFGLPGYEVSPRLAGLGTALSLGVGVLAGLIPGLGLARLQPVRALRADAV